MRNSLIIALVFGALVAPPVLKANITYEVNLTVGAGSMTGSITTDGTIGALGTGDIVGWNLTLNDGTSIADLTTSNSVTNVIGTDLTGSLSAILFNFSAGDESQFVFYNQTSEPNYGTVCIEAGNNCGATSLTSSCTTSTRTAATLPLT
jgi:L-fucose isomerase-like protein